MTRSEGGIGERAERARFRRILLIMSVCALLGFLPGLFIGSTNADSLFDESTDWPAWLSIGMTALLIGASLIGGWLAQRHYDEHQRLILYKSANFAALTYLCSYPGWFFLWKGGFLPEPMHGALFAIFYLCFVIGYVYNRLKS